MNRLTELSLLFRAVAVRELFYFLVAYGNATSLVLGLVEPADGLARVAIGLLLVAAMLIWARWAAHLGVADLGLTRAGAMRSACLGLLTALVAIVPALLILRFPPIIGQPITYAPLERLSQGDVLWRAFLFMPLDTILPEELAFRGVLLSALRQRYLAARAVLLSAVPFALWHGVLVSRTLELTNLSDAPLAFGLGLFGAFGAVFLGGLLFGALRVATGHLASSLAAHWGFNAALLLGLHALQA